MKQLLVTNDFPPMRGGEARWYARLAGSVPSSSVVVLAPRYPGDKAFDRAQDYRIIRVRVPTTVHPAGRLLQLAGLLIAVVREVRRERIDVIHIAHLYFGVIALIIRRITGTPYVLYLHGGELAPYMRFRIVRAIVRRSVDRAARVVVNSEFTREHFARLGAANPRTALLPISVPTHTFRPDVDGAKSRAAYSVNGIPLILTVGRLVERKGHDCVIRALPELKARIGPVRYLIAGEGPERTRLQRLAGELGCADDVVFAGHVPDDELPALYAACDLFVMPSRALTGRDGVEGYGIVFLEAAASGRPSVGGRSGGVAEAVLDGVTGVLTDPHDPQAVADSIARLLLDRDRAQRLGLAGREHALERERAWTQAVESLWETG